MSLPLDGCGWFGVDVVANAVHSLYLINNVVGDLCQEVVGEECHSLLLFSVSLLFSRGHTFHLGCRVIPIIALTILL